MRNLKRFFNSLFNGTASTKESKVHSKRWILVLAVAAALLSGGCPKNDPLQAFNPPSTPTDPGPAPVPEPVTALLVGATLLIGGAIVRRRRSGGPK